MADNEHEPTGLSAGPFRFLGACAQIVLDKQTRGTASFSASQMRAVTLLLASAAHPDNSNARAPPEQQGLVATIAGSGLLNSNDGTELVDIDSPSGSPKDAPLVKTSIGGYRHASVDVSGIEAEQITAKAAKPKASKTNPTATKTVRVGGDDDDEEEGDGRGADDGVAETLTSSIDNEIAIARLDKAQKQDREKASDKEKDSEEVPVDAEEKANAVKTTNGSSSSQPTSALTSPTDNNNEEDGPFGRVASRDTTPRPTPKATFIDPPEAEGSPDDNVPFTKSVDADSSTSTGNKPGVVGPPGAAVSRSPGDGQILGRERSSSRSSFGRRGSNLSGAGGGSFARRRSSVASLKSEGSDEGARRDGYRRKGSVCLNVDGVIMFDQHNYESGSWVDVVDLYGTDEPLLPKDLSSADVEQGTQPDCFFITAVSLLAQFPALVESLFLSRQHPEVPEDGSPRMYSFRFWRWDKWVEVRVDGRVPAAQNDKKPAFARSPNKRLWALLLEKAYAAFYGGFECLEGGNLAETMHDLTGKPVVNLTFDRQVLANLSWGINPLTDVSFWVGLERQFQERQVMSSAGTTTEVPSALGLQPGHAYAVLGVFNCVPKKAKDPALEHFVVKLLNPYRGTFYTGKAKSSSKGPDNAALWKSFDSATLKKHGLSPPPAESSNGKKGSTPPPDTEDGTNVFAIPLTEFTEYFAGIQTCRLDIDTPDTLQNVCKSGSTMYSVHSFEFDFDRESAGGNFNNITWRKNPTFVVKHQSTAAVDGSSSGGGKGGKGAGSAKKDIPIVVTLKQPERRTVETKASDSLSYLQGGVTLAEVGTKKKTPNGDQWIPLATPTSWRCASNCRVLQKPFYYNQRETSTLMTIPKSLETGYIVPSTFNAHEISKGLITIAVPKADSHLLFVDEYRPEYADPELSEEFDVTEGKTNFFKVHVKRTIASAAPIEAHVLLTQLKNWDRRTSDVTGQGDVVASHFMSMECQSVPEHERIAGMAAATNYREVALVFEFPVGEEEGAEHDYLIAVTCAKGQGEVSCRLTMAIRPEGAVADGGVTLTAVKPKAPKTAQTEKTDGAAGAGLQRRRSSVRPPPKEGGTSTPANGRTPATSPLPEKNPAPPTATAGGKGKAPAPAAKAGGTKTTPAAPAGKGPAKGVAGKTPTAPASKGSAKAPANDASAKKTPAPPPKKAPAKTSGAPAPSKAPAKQPAKAKAPAPPAGGKKAAAPAPKSMSRAKQVVKSVGDTYADLE